MIKNIFKKSKKFVILFALVFLFLTVTHTAFALETNYPRIIGFPTISSTEGNCKNGGDSSKCLPDLITYFFGFAITVAGVLGVFAIVIAGIRLLTSAGNPSAMSDARERIFGTILGIVLLMFCVILLQTINPALVNVKTIRLTPTIRPGEYILTRTPPGGSASNPFGINIAKADDFSEALEDEYDVEEALEDDFDTTDLSQQEVWLLVVCDPGDSYKPDNGGRVVYLYPNETEVNDTDINADVKIMNCVKLNNDLSNLFDPNITTSLAGIDSYKTALAEPGVYLFKEAGCDQNPEGNGTDVITQDLSDIPLEFQESGIGSVLIINGDKKKYGTVLNSSPSQTGECSIPYVNLEPDTRECIDIADSSFCSDVTITKCTFDNKCSEDGDGGICNSDEECAPGKTWCNENDQCTTEGLGNPCDIDNGDADCQPPPGSKCDLDNNVCSPDGTGIDCTSNTECEQETRCNENNQCTTSGSGGICDIANGDADCTPGQTRCDSGNPSQCTVNGTGDICSFDEECLPESDFFLNANKTGNGTGTVTSNENPPKINCGVGCGGVSQIYPSGATVTLTPTATAGSIFAGWSGDCTGLMGNCTVTMDAEKTVTARFNLATFILTAARIGNGQGTVASDPAGISCGSDCSEGYENGTSVRLDPVAAAGSIFAGWQQGGAGCSGTGSCTVIMNANKTAVAQFDPTEFPLTVFKDGNGQGLVHSSPGISCGSDCSESYQNSTPPILVELFADPYPGSTFDGWSGACSGSNRMCTVTMNGAKTVRAAFNPNSTTFTLEVTKAGTGVGTVETIPPTTPAFDCPPTCNGASINYSDGSLVKLKAIPSPGSVFISWSGSCSGTEDCAVTMNANQDVEATFQLTATGTFTLNVIKTGESADLGLVKSNLAGIDCEPTCNAVYQSGKIVTLTATPVSIFTGWSGEGCSGTGACIVTMNGNKTVTATFNTAELTLKKAVSGGTADLTAWTLKATGPTNLSGITGNAGVTGAIVKAGAYTLSETGPGGYTPSLYSCIKNGTPPYVSSNSITLDDGDSVVCIITNTFITTPTATLTLVKSVINTGGGTASATAWTLTASLGGAPILSGTTPVTGSVPAGTYTLSESNGPAGYTQSVWQCSNGVTVNANSQITLTGGQVTTCTITNTFITSGIFNINVYKVGTGTVKSGIGDIDCGFTCTTTRTSGTGIVLTATPGAGSDFTGWSGIGINCPGTGSCTISNITSDKNVTATFTLKPARLIVKKVVVNTGGGTAIAGSFTPYTVQRLADQTIQQITLTPLSFTTAQSSPIALPAGQYAIGEDEDPNYQVTWSSNCFNGIVFLNSDMTETCTITNTYLPLPGFLTVKKIVNNNGCVGPNCLDEFDFILVVSDANGGSDMFTSGIPQQLPPGPYNVDELIDPNYTETFPGTVNINGVSTTNNCNSSGDVLVSSGTSKTCYIVNTYKIPGKLTLKKACVPAADTGLFNFEVDGNIIPTGTGIGCGEDTGQFEVSSGVPHIISEDMPPGLNLADYTTIISGTGCPTALGQSVTVAAGAAKTCTIINTRILRSISGKVWIDTNENKTQQSPGEINYSGALITLSGTQTATTLTDVNGNYTFTNRPNGPYTVGITLQNGYILTTNPPAPGLGNPIAVILNGASITTRNFGIKLTTFPPTASIAVSPPSIPVGNAAGLTWASTDANSCNATGAWSGNKPANGSQSTGIINTPGIYTYTIACSGPGGTSLPVSATLTVGGGQLPYYKPNNPLGASLAALEKLPILSNIINALSKKEPTTTVVNSPPLTALPNIRLADTIGGANIRLAAETTLPSCGMHVASVRIINLANPNQNGSYGIPGNGISFYEDGGLDEDGSRLDGPNFVNVDRYRIDEEWKYPSPDDLLKKEGVPQNPAPNPVGPSACTTGANYYPCTGAVDIRGNFAVFLYSANEDGTDKFNKTCQRFDSTIDDFYALKYSGQILDNGKRIYGDLDPIIDGMYIYPITPQ